MQSAMQVRLSANTNRALGRFSGWVLDGRSSSRASRHLLFYIYCLRVTFSAYNMFLVVVLPYAPAGEAARRPVCFIWQTRLLYDGGGGGPAGCLP